MKADGDGGAKEFRAERTHVCDAGDRLCAHTETAEAAGAEEALWGHAVTRIERASGRWWAHNDEYGSLVHFCPWCGAHLPSDDG